MFDGNPKIIPPERRTDQVCVVVGTRPGIIKMSPIIKQLNTRRIPHFILHTGQHYSYEMDRKFFDELGLPSVRHHLPASRPGCFHGEQTAQMLGGIEQVLLSERPRVVLVCGDANTNLAGALGARKLHLDVGHVESGLRSHDWRMPEEHNRVMIDHISDYLFAPTVRAVENLAGDGVRGAVYLTGNTIVDALLSHAELAETRSRILGELKLEGGSYFLLTIHREENVDVQAALAQIVESIDVLQREFKLPIVFPCHPRTKRRLVEMGLEERIATARHFIQTDPLGYFDFLQLLKHAALVVTDSGGVQEESCVLQIPCVTLRDCTERQEAVEAGSTVVSTLHPESIVSSVREMLARNRKWHNPFGDGRAAIRIIDIIQGCVPEPLPPTTETL